MRRFRLIRRLFALAAIGFLIWKYAPWPTRTIAFNEQNFKCQIPYNWSLKDNPRFVIEANRPYGGSFVVSAKSCSPSLKIDDPIFSDTIKNKVTADGYEVLNEDRSPFEGHVAYAYTMRKTINGKVIYAHSVNFVAGQFRYDIVIAIRDIDPRQDAQLQKAVDSFRLIDPVPK